MATMDKATTIFGERRQITPLAFNTSHFNEIEHLIQSAIGTDWKLKRAEVAKAVAAARKDPLLKDGYVKVGVVTGHMVLRFKEKKSDGKHFTDLLLVKDYKTRAAKHVPSTDGRLTPGEFDWNALSIGDLSQEEAEKALNAAYDGAWFVRLDQNNTLAISVRQSGRFQHLTVAAAEALNLEPAYHLTTQQLGFKGQLGPLRLRELEALPGFFKRLDRGAVERLLSPKETNAWLIQAGHRDGEVAWSRKTANRVEHYVIRDEKGFVEFSRFRQRFDSLQVRS